MRDPLMPLACSACAMSPPPTSPACCGPRRCSPGSSSPRSTCSWCSATTRCRSGCRSCPRTSSWRRSRWDCPRRSSCASAFARRWRVGLLLRRGRASRCSRARRSTGNFWIDVLPGMTLLGIGAGIAFNPLLLGAMSDVAPSDSGLASGVVNTAFMMGGALGLAVLASFAAMRTDAVLATRRGQHRGAQRRLSTRVPARRDLRGHRAASSAACSCARAQRPPAARQARSTRSA